MTLYVMRNVERWALRRGVPYEKQNSFNVL